jgi:hypothetical protein
MSDPSSPPPQMTPVWTPPYPYAYGYPYQGPPPRATNGLAIAAMVVSIVGIGGLCCWGPLSVFISPVGAILGHVARHKVKDSGEQGEGMALAGILIGWIGFVLALALIAVYIFLFVQGYEMFPQDPIPTEDS